MIEQLLYDVSEALRVPVLVLALIALAVVIVEAGALLVELRRRRYRDLPGLERAVEECRGRLAASAPAEALAALLQRGAALASPNEGIQRQPPDPFRMPLGEQRRPQRAGGHAVHQQLVRGASAEDVLAGRLQVVGARGVQRLFVWEIFTEHAGQVADVFRVRLDDGNDVEVEQILHRQHPVPGRLAGARVILDGAGVTQIKADANARR